MEKFLKNYKIKICKPKAYENTKTIEFKIVNSYLSQF